MILTSPGEGEVDSKREEEVEAHVTKEWNGNVE